MRKERSMTKITRRHLALALLGASTALAVVAAPYQLTAMGFAPAAALAEDGEGSDHDGGESSGHDGGESSDHDGGESSDHDSDGGESGSDGGDDSSDRSGDDDNGGDDGRDGAEHVNSATGDKVEINGSNIEVEHPDGTKEEIERGRYEMKDASGRTIVERPATDADRARLEAMAG
jgi:hypothetical protein